MHRCSNIYLPQYLECFISYATPCSNGIGGIYDNSWLLCLNFQLHKINVDNQESSIKHPRPIMVISTCQSMHTLPSIVNNADSLTAINKEPVCNPLRSFGFHTWAFNGLDSTVCIFGVLDSIQEFQTLILATHIDVFAQKKCWKSITDKNKNEIRFVLCLDKDPPPHTQTRWYPSLRLCVWGYSCHCGMQ